MTWSWPWQCWWYSFLWRTEVEMTKISEAIGAIARKLGLKMSYKKTQITSNGVPTPSFHLETKISSRLWTTSSALKVSAVPMGPMSKSWTAELRKHEQLSESGKIKTSIWTPKWHFTMSVSFPHFYMHVCAGQSLREMKPDLMPLPCAASAGSYMLCGHSILQQLHKSRTRQLQLTVVITKHTTYNVLVIYREWTWTVSLRNCTSGSQPMENKLADQKLFRKQPFRKTSAKRTWVGLQKR